MKILVTGSSGLIGTKVTQDLTKKFKNVFSIYHNSHPEYGIPVHLDLTKSDDVLKTLEKIKPDVIIHLAALTNVDACEEDPDLAFKINVESTMSICKFVEKNNVYLIYVSTDYIFDGKNGMRCEDDDAIPTTIYGKTKLEGEKIIKNITTKWCIVRTSTPFGYNKTKKNFLLWVVQSLLQHKEISIVTDQYTSPVYIPNFSSMLEEIIEKQICGVIHLTGASKISRYELAVLISKKTFLDTNLIKPILSNEMTWKIPRPQDCSLDVSKASTILDNSPKTISLSLDLFVNDLKISGILK